LVRRSGTLAFVFERWTLAFLFQPGLGTPGKQGFFPLLHMDDDAVDAISTF
jgi:hypothetical protein